MDSAIKVDHDAELLKLYQVAYSKFELLGIFLQVMQNQRKTRKHKKDSKSNRDMAQKSQKILHLKVVKKPFFFMWYP